MRGLRELARAETGSLRRLALGTAAVALLVAAACVIDQVVVPRVLREAADADAAPGLLASLLRAHAAVNPAHRTLELYQQHFDRAFRAGLVACVFLQLGVVALAFRRRSARAMHAFFREPESPLNLAIFRIALFTTLFLAVEPDVVGFYGGFPDSLLFAPAGLGDLLAGLPRSEALAHGASLLLRVVCVTGAVGLFTRSSSLLAALLAFYVLGLPQLFGKVNHYHHLVWLPAILAASPAGHVLSVDGVLRARRLADRGIVARPPASAAYTAPLRWVVLLLGALYFFPGLWKWVVGGPEWIFSDNLRFVLYRNWLSHADPSAFPRVDRVPGLLEAGAAATLLFEMGVVVAVLFRRTRSLVGLAGLVFHHTTTLTMGIRFVVLRRLYVVFFDWGRIFDWLGRRLQRDVLEVRYDPASRSTRRALASLASFDLFGRVEYRPGETGAPLRAARAASQLTGCAAWRALLWRIPPLWIALPLLELPPVARRLDAAAVAGATGSRGGFPPPRPAAGFAVHAVAGLCLAATLAYGFAGESHAWPFACYPKFSSVVSRPEVTWLGFDVRDSDGARIDLDRGTMNRRFKRARFRALMQRIVATRDPALREERVQALWSRMEQADPRLRLADHVRVYRDRLSTLPEERAANPIERSLLLERSALQESKRRSDHHGKKLGMSSDTFMRNLAGRFSRKLVTPS